MTTHEYSFDSKGHTRASTPDDLAEDPYTINDTRRERGSLLASVSVLAVGATAIAALAFNDSMSKDNMPMTPQKIETPHSSH